MATPYSLRDLSPLRVLIGSEDVTNYVGDGGMTFSNVDPGGFEAASFQLPKDMPQTIRGLNVRIDSGLRVAWEGRISEVQRSLGNSTSITCEGYGAVLTDNTGSMVFVDRDLTRWQDPSYTQQLSIATANRTLDSSQVAADPTSGTPALVQTIAGGANNVSLCQSWYDSGPENFVGEIYYDLTSDSAVGSGSYITTVNISTDANATSVQTSSNLTNSSEQTGYFNPVSGGRFAFLNFVFSGALPGPGTSGKNFNSYWRQMAVYGPHNLTGQGSDPHGFYPSQIVNWVLTQVPAGLQAGFIQTTDAGGYIVPHSVYYTPVQLAQIVGDMATIQGWHWGVWESPSPLTGGATPRLDFRPRPGPGQFTAYVQRSACETCDIREDLSQQYNKAVITWTDVSGVTGATIVTTDNPVLDAAGIGTRTLVLNGGTMTPATAALFGAEALALTNAEQKVAGSIDLITTVDAPSGPLAPYLLKSGVDRIRVGDAPSQDAWGASSDYPITRVEASISSSGLTCSIEVGAGADLVEALNARLSAATALAAQGG